MSYWMVWTLWLCAIAIVVVVPFAIFESRALKHSARANQITLSHYCYTIGSTWPLSIALAAYFAGAFTWGFFVHVLWHWCPPGSVTGG
jgi:hypothetical protein